MYLYDIMPSFLVSTKVTIGAYAVKKTLYTKVTRGIQRVKYIHEGDFH